MKLIVNGQEKTYDKDMSIKNIIDDLDIESKVMAAAVNMNVVKKENWAEYIPNDGDKLEFLEFVGGG
jgi:sulfur carrier protein